MVSYSARVSRWYARLVGRSLQLLIKELSHEGIGIGFQGMLGVRDQARTVARFDSQMGGDYPLLAEMDMDDMFWENPIQKVFQAVK